MARTTKPRKPKTKRGAQEPPGVVFGTRLDSDAELILTGLALYAHKFLIGITGSGKSKLLVSMIVQLINLGYSCIVLDPHTDLVHDILLTLWATGFYEDPRAHGRVKYFSFAGTGGRFPAFNVLAQPGHSPQEIARWVWNALTRAWVGLGEGAAPMMEQVFLSSLVVLIENHQPITKLHQLLTDATYRAQLLQRVTDTQVRQFFSWFDAVGKRSALVSETALRRAYLMQFPPALRYSLGASENLLDLRTAMDQGSSVLCDLGGLDEETQRMLGCLLTGQAETAALSRANVPETARRPAFLILDEWSMFASQSEVALERMLALCRKYGLSVCLACQTLGQTRTLQSALQNCIPVVMRLGGLDAAWGAARIGTYDPRRVKATASGHPTFVSRSEQQAECADRLERLPARHAIVRLGEESIPFYTLGLPPVQGRERILSMLTQHYREILLRPAASPAARPTASSKVTVCETSQFRCYCCIVSCYQSATNQLVMKRCRSPSLTAYTAAGGGDGSRGWISPHSASDKARDTQRWCQQCQTFPRLAAYPRGLHIRFLRPLAPLQETHLQLTSVRLDAKTNPPDYTYQNPSCLAESTVAVAHTCLLLAALGVDYLTSQGEIHAASSAT